MDLAMRLEILHRAGEIGDETLSRMQHLIGWFDERHKIQLTEENSSAFVTHAAMALERVKRNEEIAPLAPVLQTEIENHPTFAKGKAIWAEMMELWGVALPPEEKGYFLLHLCTLLSKE